MAPSVSFAELLQSAVTEPGIISKAYQQFHNYSIGNQLLAWAQCLERGIRPGPLATFPRWKELGRWVRKGERAITLCMPVLIKRTPQHDDDSEQPEILTRFIYKPHWFVLAQTDGKSMPEPEIPTWDKCRALTTLQIDEIPFDHMNGNCLGFARNRSIAINPVNPMPHKTRFHELAHVLLGHTAEGTLNDDECTLRNLRECEAEAVALLCCAALDLPGVDHTPSFADDRLGQKLRQMNLVNVTVMDDLWLLTLTSGLDNPAFKRGKAGWIVSSSLPSGMIHLKFLEVGADYFSLADPNHPLVRWVYWIGREHWGKGVATSALRQFVDLLGERPLFAHVAKHNVGSIRVLEKCGFAALSEEAGKDGVVEVLMRLD